MGNTYKVLLLILLAFLSGFSVSSNYWPGCGWDHRIYAQAPVVQHAVMEEGFLVKRLEDLKENESGFATPDSLVVDENKRCWLNPYAATVQEDTKFKVTRKPDGFHVEVKEKNIRWSKVPLEIAITDQTLRSKMQPVRTITLEKQ
jgi:hypothetical protein